MSASLITYITQPLYIMAANSCEYYISQGINNTIVLPLITTQNIPINIINMTSGNLSIVDSNNISVLMLPSFSVVILISAGGVWNLTSSSNTSPKTSNTSLALIPILIDDSQSNNNGFFGTSSSSNLATTDSYFPFTTGGLQFWAPNTTGQEYLQIVSPIPFVVNATMLQLRGATTSNYFSGARILATNDNINYLTLYNYTSAQMQTPATSVVYVQFNNNTPYTTYRLLITFTVGSNTTLGIFNMQLFGYYPAV